MDFAEIAGACDGLETTVPTGGGVTLTQVGAVVFCHAFPV
jgi:hypothetical protein